MSLVASVGGSSEGDLFSHAVSVANLLEAWQEFKRGKRKKKDVAQFELHLEDNLFRLHEELVTKTYIHDSYDAFYVCDPKRRHIHKASVRDRVVHQAFFRILYPVFDKHFIYDSFSSRNEKGTHKGVDRLMIACRKVSKNWKAQTWTLKCDVRKFFDSIDHAILRELIVKQIDDKDVMWFIDLVFASFEKEQGKGLPLGNVTSQLFANIYLNELDQHVKHVLKAHYYFRYCDDFVIVHQSRIFLEDALQKITVFLGVKLCLTLHPQKVEIRKASQGIDFLGYVILPHAIVIRTKTKKRISRKLREALVLFRNDKLSTETFQSMVTSYLGVFSHAKAKKAIVYFNSLSEILKKSSE